MYHCNGRAINWITNRVQSALIEIKHCEYLVQDSWSDKPFTIEQRELHYATSKLQLPNPAQQRACGRPLHSKTSPRLRNHGQSVSKKTRPKSVDSLLCRISCASFGSMAAFCSQSKTDSTSLFLVMYMGQHPLRLRQFGWLVR